jgi:rhodanese-related sulfurtransferase/DNA-binding transcriptional ArsR family regulator
MLEHMASRQRRFKDGVYEQLGRIGKTVAAPKRIELLDLLAQGPRTVEALADVCAMSVANTSRHLQLLRAARLVEAQKKGSHVEYRLAGDEVGHFLLALRTLADARLAEIEQAVRNYFGERDSMEGLQRDELVRRVRNGEVTVLDVRPAEEYAAGHIPGAISIPVGELKARLKELPKGSEIVAYCRGPYCVMSAEAVALLRAKGFEAHRMAHGVVEWRARGWRVEAEREAARPRPRLMSEKERKL